jgi:alginate O-acetyltransferase complex protein AlgI
MLFNSFNFIVFFAAITILYYIFPYKLRWVLLLAGSYYFYMCWKAEFIVLLIFITFLNYVSARAIYGAGGRKNKKTILFISLVLNFGILFVFKYMNFFSQSVSEIMAVLGMHYTVKEFDIILPMGISFFTFQAASYTIDVYKGKIKPVKHYGKFSLFISFFPQLVAGPIERSENLLPQFYKKHRFSMAKTVDGLKIMLWGFFKKVVIADRAAIAVNTVFNGCEYYSGLYLVLASLLFTVQIYCDFSGYSDIAKGSAKVLGFDLMDNFKRPFISKNIKEFWKRWHVSLSSWFMDYVYIPLGGNRKGNLMKYRNLLITFMVSGLWHGAAWTFVIWGGIHGVLLVVYNIFAPALYKIKSVLGVDKSRILSSAYGFFASAVTFGFVVFAFIFFRANSVEDAFYIISHMLWNFRIWNTPQYLFDVFTGMGIGIFEWKILISAVIFLMGTEILCGEDIHKTIGRRNALLKFAFYGAAALFVLLAGVFYNAGEFIYFQF